LITAGGYEFKKYCNLFEMGRAKLWTTLRGLLHTAVESLALLVHTVKLKNVSCKDLVSFIHEHLPTLILF
jgi:hypothetical protein